MINRIVSKRDYHTEDYTTLTSDNIDDVNEKEKDMYLVLVLIAHACPIQYKKLQDDLENDFSKGNDLYPKTLVKAYHLLNEFKCTKVKLDTPFISDSALVFSQNIIPNGQRNTAKKEPQCFGCGKKGYTIVSCPDCKAKKKGSNKTQEPQNNTEKRLTFAQDVDSQKTDGSQFGIGCFCVNENISATQLSNG